MGECFLTVTVASPTPVDFQTGDYIDYRGERFSIDYDPELLKKSSFGTYGEGFTYTDIKFSSRASELERMRFHDRVLSDSSMSYTSLPDVVVYCGSVDDFVDRLQANANAWCKASGIDIHDYWMFYTYDKSRLSARINDMTTDESERASLLSEKSALWTTAYGNGTGDARKDEKFDRNISMSGQTVAEALSAVKTYFGLNYIIYGRNVYIGMAGISAGHVFKYGKGNGLYEIERSVNQDYPVYTKIHAYGSTDNLPSGYYNTLNTSVYANIEEIKSIATGELYAYYVDFTIDIDFLPRLFTYPRKYNADDDSYVVQISVGGNTALGRIYSLTDIDGNTETRVYCEYGVNASYPEDNLNLEDFKKFLSGVEAGKVVYFTGYVNKSAWPSDHKIALTENLPDNMAVNSLMLPGFPNMALSEICRSVYDEKTGITSFQIRKSIDSSEWTTFHTESGKHLVEWSTDAHDPYLLSPNVGIYGIREGDVHANEEDDSNGLEAVYPTIEKMTDIEAGTGTSNVRLDAVTEAPVIDDNGSYPKNGKSTIPGFTVIIPDLGFSLSQAIMDAGGKSCVLGMKDGYCAGREFAVSTARQNSDGTWSLRCKRSQDSSLGLYFPYSYHKSIGESSSSDEPYQILAGDHYVLTGISLESTSYVWAAGVRLLKKAIHWLCENDHPRYVYTPRIDEIFMARQSDLAVLTGGSSLHDELKEGCLMDFSDSDIGISGSVYIEKLTIKENGNNGIPTYEVTLKDDTKSGTIQQMQGQLSVLGSGMDEASASASSAQEAADETAENIALIQDDLKKVAAGLAQKVDTAWFASLFTVYDKDGLKVSPNDYEKTVESIRSMFGFWTDRYLSALGKTDNVAYHEVYLTDENGNYLLDSEGNYITTTRLLAALEGGLTEDELWSLLSAGGAGDVYETAQIGLEHLRDALEEYVGALDLGGYAQAADVTVLRSYFTDGKANKALRLANTVAVGSASQPVFFTAEGVPSVCGAYSTLLTALGYDAAARLLSVTVGGTTKTAVLPVATATVAGLVSTAAQTFGGVKTFAAGTLVIGSGSRCVTLSVDADGCLHIDKGVYSDGFVSALGKSDATAGTGMSEAEMWEALGTDAETQVIPAEHLDLSGVSVDADLSGYYTAEQTDALLATKSTTGHTHTKSQITDFPTSLKNPTALSWSGYSSGSYDGSAAKSFSIPNNTNQLTNGAGFITSSASITGNAATATKLQTARTLTIGSTGKTFNGTANVSWSLSEIGAAAASHTGHPNIELFPGASAGHGGYIDFHHNDSTADYTSRIIAWKSGTLTLEADNGVTATGTLTATNFIATSDMRLKDVLGAAELTAGTLAAAPLFRFRWKGGGDEVFVGTSAQYWQEACPEVVGEGDDGRLGVDYGALGVAAGVSLAREVVELRSRVKTLEERLAWLEAVVAKLTEGDA